MTNRGRKKRPRGDPSPEEQEKIFRRIAAMRRIKQRRGEKANPLFMIDEETDTEEVLEIDEDFMEDIDA